MIVIKLYEAFDWNPLAYDLQVVCNECGQLVDVITQAELDQNNREGYDGVDLCDNCWEKDENTLEHPLLLCKENSSIGFVYNMQVDPCHIGKTQAEGKIIYVTFVEININAKP